MKSISFLILIKELKNKMVLKIDKVTWKHNFEKYERKKKVTEFFLIFEWCHSF